VKHKQTPVGAKCWCTGSVGLVEEGNNIKVYAEIHDAKYIKHKATIKLDIDL